MGHPTIWILLFIVLYSVLSAICDVDQAEKRFWSFIFYNLRGLRNSGKAQ